MWEEDEDEDEDEAETRRAQGGIRVDSRVVTCDRGASASPEVWPSLSAYDLHANHIRSLLLATTFRPYPYKPLSLWTKLARK